MTNTDKKLNKLCKKIEKEFEGGVILGKTFKGEKNITIPVSIKKAKTKDAHQSLYGEPVGLIEIIDDDMRFIPIDRQKSNIKFIFKIIVLIFTIFGLKKVLSSEKRWDFEG